MRVAIIGVGTTGSWLATALVRYADVDLTVIDFDKVEKHNVANQIYFQQQVGLPKVVALYNILRRVNPGALIKPVKARVTASNVDELLKGADVIVDCTDNEASQAVLQEHCRRVRKFYVRVGLAPSGRTGIVYASFSPSLSDGRNTQEATLVCERREVVPLVFKLVGIALPMIVNQKEGIEAVV